MGEQGIPEFWKIYLERSYTEFKIIQEDFLVWAKKHSEKVAKLPPAQQEKEMNDPDVPDLTVKVPADDLETAQSEKQEW